MTGTETTLLGLLLAALQSQDELSAGVLADFLKEQGREQEAEKLLRLLRLQAVVRNWEAHAKDQNKKRWTEDVVTIDWENQVDLEEAWEAVLWYCDGLRRFRVVITAPWTDIFVYEKDDPNLLVRVLHDGTDLPAKGVAKVTEITFNGFAWEAKGPSRHYLFTRSPEVWITPTRNRRVIARLSRD